MAGIQGRGVRGREQEREGGLFALTSIGHGFHKLCILLPNVIKYGEFR